MPLAIAIPAAVVLTSITALLVWWFRRKAVQASFKKLALQLKNPPESAALDDSAFLNDQVNSLSYNRSYEIDRNLFTVSNTVLGQGEFGSVFKGELSLQSSDEATGFDVAIKVPKSCSNLQCHRALVDELKIMCHIRPHVNVLALVGACTDELEKKQLFVLTEFCENGSLRNYLITNYMRFEGFATTESGQFEGAPGAVDRLLNYAYQAANGMKHLAAENIIHRDLALRNLLLTDKHIVKISDFGMSRRHNTIYRKPLSTNEAVPMFWMAIESLSSGQYTQKSDVWSFGILLWEMFSCGVTPCPKNDPNISFGEFSSWVREKETNRLGLPRIACDEMYQLMIDCWKENPEARPTFNECKRIIARALDERSPSTYRLISMVLSQPVSLANNTNNINAANTTTSEFIDEFSDAVTLLDPSTAVVAPEAADVTTQKDYSRPISYVSNSLELLDRPQGTSPNVAYVIVDPTANNVSAI